MERRIGLFKPKIQDTREYKEEEVASLFTDIEVLYQRDESVLLDGFAGDIKHVQRLQGQWDQALGIVPTRKELLRNHNPVFARFNYETATTAEERDAVKKHELKMMEAGLRERYHADGFSTYIIDAEGKLRNELWLKEPFEDVMRRGIAIRAENGSDEKERENSELEGFLTIQNKLIDPNTPVGTTFISLSSPSEKPETPYGDKYVDRFQKTQNAITGEIEIRLTRLVKDWTNEQYAKVAEQLQPGYFDALTTESRDSYFLSNPIHLSPEESGASLDKILEQFGTPEDKLLEHQIRQIIEIVLPYILEYYIRPLTSREFTPIDIAEGFNVSYNKADKTYKLFQSRDKEKLATFTKAEQSLSFSQRAHERAVWGRRAAVMLDAACGFSGGFAIDNESSIVASSPLANSVAMFGVPEGSFGEKKLKCKCPFCNEKVEAIIKDGKIKCPRGACGKSVPYNC